MKSHIKYVAGILLAILCTSALAGRMDKHEKSDIYLVIYTTKKGYTGHVGFAVDNYKIIVRETINGVEKTSVYDSVRNSSVTYFDLWGPAEIGVADLDNDLPARYYTLPRSSSEKRITVDYFLTRGLPHSYNYPCDALIRIRTTPAQDAKLRSIAEAVQQEKNFFNGRDYNCTDYVLECLNRLFKQNITAQEYIPFKWSSTPNQFYIKILERLNVDVLKKAGEEVNSSFLKERVINTIIYNQYINHEKTN